jgi:hypothetical protein
LWRRPSSPDSSHHWDDSLEKKATSEALTDVREGGAELELGDAGEEEEDEKLEEREGVEEGEGE